MIRHVSGLKERHTGPKQERKGGNDRIACSRNIKDMQCVVRDMNRPSYLMVIRRKSVLPPRQYHRCVEPAAQ